MKESRTFSDWYWGECRNHRRTEYAPDVQSDVVPPDFHHQRRQPLIQPSLQEALYGRLGALTQEHGGRLVEIGGMPDHIHLLLEGKPTLSMAILVHRLKGSTSHWLMERGAKEPGEAFWQRGYGIFTVSESNRERIRRYILNQPEHHRERSSREELLLLLKKHHVPVDPDRLDDEE